MSVYIDSFIDYTYLHIAIVTKFVTVTDDTNISLFADVFRTNSRSSSKHSRFFCGFFRRLLLCVFQFFFRGGLPRSVSMLLRQGKFCRVRAPVGSSPGGDGIGPGRAKLWMIPGPVGAVVEG